MSDIDSRASNGVKLIFACSGAADVGEIADRAARKMSKDGIGTMFCLAGVGGRVEPVMQKAKSASKILAIDGCELDCVKNCFLRADIRQFEHLRVTDLGMKKGNSPATDENIAEVADKGTQKLR